jgi:CBS domain-containing protein
MDLIAREAQVEVPTVLPFLDAFIRADAGRRFDDEMRQALATTVGELMTPRVVTVRPHATLTQLATVMVERDLSTLPVVDDDDRLIGLVSRTDLVRVIARLEAYG